jgi:voltage-gated potassium channel
MLVYFVISMLTLLSIMFYAIGLISDTEVFVEHKQVLVWEIFLVLILGFDMCVSIAMSHNDHNYLTSWIGICEVLSIFVPLISVIAYGTETDSFGWFRLLRLGKVFDRIHTRKNNLLEGKGEVGLLQVYSARLRTEVLQLMFAVILIIFIFSSMFYLFEKHKWAQFTTAHSVEGNLPYYLFLYFTLVTITTVGYGDVIPDDSTSTFLVMLFLVVSFTVIPERLKSLTDLLELQPNQQKLKKKCHVPHIILVGTFSTEDEQLFLRLLESDGAGDYRRKFLVILSPQKMTSALEVMLEGNTFRDRVQFFQGAMRSEHLLATMAAHTAEAILIMDANLHKNQHTSKNITVSDNIFNSLFLYHHIKQQCAMTKDRSDSFGIDLGEDRIPLLMVEDTGFDPSVNEFMRAGANTVEFMPINEIRVASLAHGALIPGFTALIMHLLQHGNHDYLTSKLQSDGTDGWRREVGYSGNNYIHQIALSQIDNVTIKSLIFQEACSHLYTVSEGTILLIGAMDDEGVHINPIESARVEKYLSLFVICTSRRKALRAFGYKKLGPSLLLENADDDSDLDDEEIGPMNSNFSALDTEEEAAGEALPNLSRKSSLGGKLSFETDKGASAHSSYDDERICGPVEAIEHSCLSDDESIPVRTPRNTAPRISFFSESADDRSIVDTAQVKVDVVEESVSETTPEVQPKPKLKSRGWEILLRCRKDLIKLAKKFKGGSIELVSLRELTAFRHHVIIVSGENTSMIETEVSVFQACLHLSKFLVKDIVVLVDATEVQIQKLMVRLKNHFDLKRDKSILLNPNGTPKQRSTGEIYDLRSNIFLVMCSPSAKTALDLSSMKYSRAVIILAQRTIVGDHPAPRTGKNIMVETSEVVNDKTAMMVSLEVTEMISRNGIRGIGDILALDGANRMKHDDSDTFLVFEVVDESSLKFLLTWRKMQSDLKNASKQKLRLIEPRSSSEAIDKYSLFSSQMHSSAYDNGDGGPIDSFSAFSLHIFRQLGRYIFRVDEAWLRGLKSSYFLDSVSALIRSDKRADTRSIFNIPTVAGGHAVLPCLFNIIMVDSVYNPQIQYFWAALMGIGRKGLFPRSLGAPREAYEQPGKKVRIQDDWMEDMNSGYECKDIGNIRSYRDVCKAGTGTPKITYGEIFHHLLLHDGSICIGLYRKVVSSTTGEKKGQMYMTGSYTVTNPKASTVLRPSDIVYSIIPSAPKNFKSPLA